jgi:GTP-binding protein
LAKTPSFLWQKNPIFVVMEIVKAEFIISNTDITKCPKPDMPEVAFIGRSNVGKSSLINMLANKKSMAKTSSTPGKTQLINHFLINKNMYWVDLPGYGYAKVSQSQRGTWTKMIWNYVEKRENLRTLFVLIDSRHEPQKKDIEIINKLGEKQIPFALIFTKADKETQKEVSKNVSIFKNEMKKFWEVLPPVFVTSAEKRLGRKNVLDYIELISFSSEEEVEEQVISVEA